MANKINFTTGETYTLSELFSGNRKIIIPDLQRDYCWGNNTHTKDDRELVSAFIDNIITMFKLFSKEKLSLGLIYGYEEPANHIQLCDGQQRITTLFLLLGIINRYSNNRFTNHLISNFEYTEDDKEPYLQYSIRESSLYFLSDLVCEFFICNGNSKLENVAAINNQNNNWYFQDYQLDPSIQSMLRALQIIEQRIDSEIEDKEFNVSDLGDYITDKLTFMYYDMGNRRNGEETFVIINTTGEPLSATQNLKPLIINAKINKSTYSIAERWEEIETWFWKNRTNGNDTSDAGFEEFLRWITIIELAKKNNSQEINKIISSETYTFDVEATSFEEIYVYWQNTKELFETGEPLYSSEFLSPKLENKNRILTQIDCFKLLPLIAYKNKFKETDFSDTKRVYELFSNLARYQDISVDNKSVYNAIKAVLLMPNKDIISLVDIEKELSEHIYNNEEKTKLKILKANSNREAIEEAFWSVQTKEKVACHEIWRGQILPLIEWSTRDEIFDFDKFKQYADIFCRVFIGSCIENIDITRKALLTRGLNGYPRIFTGGTNYSFGWDWTDWTALIKDNKEQFKLFFDELMAAKNIEEAQQKMVDRFYDRTSWWSIFVEENNFLSYCRYKYVQKVSDDIIRLLSGKKASKDHKYLYGWQEINKNDNWTLWNNDGSNCLCTYNNTHNIAINLLVEPSNPPKERFRLKLFNKADSNKPSYDLSNIISKFSLKQAEDGRSTSDFTTSKECYELCKAIIEELKN